MNFLYMISGCPCVPVDAPDAGADSCLFEKNVLQWHERKLGWEMILLKSVLIRAKQYLPTASGAEQGALRYLLEHSEEIPQLSVKELSQRSFSSAATIVRLCRKLGFEGYRDMQKQLLFEIAVRTQEESKGNARVTAGSTSDIVYKITYRNIASLEETVKLVEPQVLERAVDLICRADSVLLFGLGASQLVAKDAYLKFIRIDKPCSCCEDIHSQYIIAKNSKPNDVAIVISYSGRTEEIVRCAEYLKAQGTPIIAITRFELSPISRMAACCLNVMASEELYRSGAMSSRIAQLNMIDILYTACINRNISQNVRIFSHNRLDTERA